jgi:hypothetical protein
MPVKAATTSAYLLLGLKSIPEKTATIIATASQKLLIVRQKFQHTILHTSKIVIVCDFHHIRQYTTQDITINPLKTGKSQLTD